MIQVVFKGGTVAHVGSDYRETRDKAAEIGGTVENRNDWKSYDQAVVAAVLVSKFTGESYVATDSGGNCSPRFDVVRAPHVGDLASFGFNGDYYPDGKVVYVSKSLRIVKTDTGRTYWRLRKTGSWKHEKTWSLVRGHHDERNPSF